MWEFPGNTTHFKLAPSPRHMSEYKVTVTVKLILHVDQLILT